MRIFSSIFWDFLIKLVPKKYPKFVFVRPRNVPYSLPHKITVLSIVTVPIKPRHVESAFKFLGNAKAQRIFLFS
jgi:hypothetical protein